MYGFRQANTEKETKNGGEEGSDKRPFPAGRFPPNCKECGGAGPVEEGKDQEVHHSEPGPAIENEQILDGCNAAELYHSSFREVAHEQNGNHNLIGGKAQEKGEEDYPIQSHEPAQRIEKACQTGD